jgi:hypothetical protein
MNVGDLVAVSADWPVCGTITDHVFKKGDLGLVVSKFKDSSTGVNFHVMFPVGIEEFASFLLEPANPYHGEEVP